MPTREQSDFSGDNYGPDLINITYNNPIIQSGVQGFKVIFNVGVYAAQAGS